jgi:hypothetical protein
MNMPRNNIAITVRHGDKGLVQVFILQPAGPKKTAVRGTLKSLLYLVAVHMSLHLFKKSPLGLIFFPGRKREHYTEKSGRP